MNNLPAAIADASIWNATLEKQENDKYEPQRERLRSVFLGFRDRCGYLSTEIRKDLPDLTIHDLSHLDALWEIASMIVGPQYSLTPTEAFVLGGAILLHDLGMSVAAMEGRNKSVEADPRWADLLTFEYRSTYDRYPTQEEFRNPEPIIRKNALFNLLRQIHAENAEKLAFLSYTTSGNSPIFLLEDTEIRQTYGRIIGQIAHSHWWSITKVENTFGRVVGAPHWCPPEWKVDPLKIACILRTADAAHLDARRAPTFVKAFSDLSPSSEKHWLFQEKLNKPYLGEDALVFTNGSAFSLNEATSWWLCLDALRMVDHELRSVDTLFAERGYPRFAAHRVAGVDTPERMASYIQTDGWLPINAMVHVTDLPNIIRSIGGEELYGAHPEIALRELVQNSCDAIRARRLYEQRDPNFGGIQVTLTQEDSEYWLEVADNGVGMSQRVLTSILLDFGRSFWGSPQMQEEFPGLLSSGLKPTGKYGIGFFSVFMIAEHVCVITRRSDMAAKDTLVLEFSSGLSGRPILRQAHKEEQLIDGGTCIRIKLKDDPNNENGLLHNRHKDKRETLVDLCNHLCPSLDVDTYVIESGLQTKVIGANDWTTMDGTKLLSRMELTSDREISEADLLSFINKAAKNLRIIKNRDGEIVGRALVTLGFAMHSEPKIDLSGVVTVGGLRSSSLTGICGVLIGQPIHASRNAAIPTLDDADLKAWAEEQTELVPNLWEKPEEQAACAQYIWMCGGDTKNLPICRFQGKWRSADEIAKLTNLPDKVILLDSFTVNYEFSLLNSYELDQNVFIVESSGLPGLLQGRVQGRRAEWPRGLDTNFTWGGGTLPQTLGGALIQAISKGWKVKPDDVFLANKGLNREKNVRVGTTDNKEIRVRAYLVSRP